MKNKSTLERHDPAMEQLVRVYENSKTSGRQEYMDTSDLVDISSYYAALAKYDEAYEACEWGLTLHPYNTELLVQKATICLEQGEIEEAENITNEIIDQPEDAVIILRGAIQLRKGEELEIVQDLFEELDDPDDLVNIICICNAYLDADYPNEVLKLLDKHKNHSNKESYITAKADAYIMLGQQKKAIELYNQAIDINPYTTYYWILLSKCYVSIDEYNKALDACDYALAINPQDSEALEMQGDIYRMLNNPEKSLDCFKRAYQTGELPQEAFHAQNGETFMQDDKYEEAVKEFTLSIQIQEMNHLEDSEVLFPLAFKYAKLAYCYNSLEQYDAACQCCEKSAELLNYTSEAPLVLKGVYQLHINGYQGAEIEWIRAFEIHRSPDVWLQAGILSVEEGYLQEALLALEKAQQYGCKAPHLNKMLSTLYLALKKKDDFIRVSKLLNPNASDADINKMYSTRMTWPDSFDIVNFAQEIISKIQIPN